MIVTKKLTKDYGKIRAVQQFDLELDRGDIFGFIGPNGSGKTTTLRMLATLLNPTSGDAWIAGHSIRSQAQKVRPMIGYMPDSLGTYDDMRVIEFLAFFGAAYGIRGNELRPRVQSLLKRVSLSDHQRQPIASLSRGMSQRLNMARVLLHDPEVLLLDEPLSNLDPIGRAEIRALIKELQQTGKTIIISSHVLAELPDVCNRVGIIHQGHLKLDSNLEMLAKHSARRVVLRIELAANMQGAAQLMTRLDIVENVETEDRFMRLTLKPGVENYGSISKAIVEAGFELLSLARENVDLESVFLEVIQTG